MAAIVIDEEDLVDWREVDGAAGNEVADVFFGHVFLSEDILEGIAPVIGTEADILGDVFTDQDVESQIMEEIFFS